LLLSQTEVGEELYRSSATVSRVERGRVGVTPRDVRDMLRLYGVEDQRQELVHLALEARKRDSFWQAYGDVPPEHRTYVELEQSAVSIRQDECLAVPGLLQSRDYATALSKAIFPNATARHVAQHVELGLSRQALLVDDDPRGSRRCSTRACSTAWWAAARSWPTSSPAWPTPPSCRTWPCW
jgi:Domain of unknown function (DUF5753)/Helix-turn-helix domain